MLLWALLDFVAFGSRRNGIVNRAWAKGRDRLRGWAYLASTASGACRGAYPQAILRTSWLFHQTRSTIALVVSLMIALDACRCHTYFWW